MSDDGGVGGILGCLLAGFLGYWFVKIGCLLLALVVILIVEGIIKLFGG